MQKNPLTLEPTPERIIDFGGEGRAERQASLQSFQIGQVARRSGLTPDTLRYYERLGLFPAPARTSGGFRMYPAGTFSRLRFIKQAQALGLSLDEIAELLRHLDRGGRSHCRRVRALLAVKLQEVDARLTKLREFRQTLQGYLEECDKSFRRHGDEPCPVTSALR